MVLPTYYSPAGLLAEPTAKNQNCTQSGIIPVNRQPAANARPHSRLRLARNRKRPVVTVATVGTAHRDQAIVICGSRLKVHDVGVHFTAQNSDTLFSRREWIKSVAEVGIGEKTGSSLTSKKTQVASGGVRPVLEESSCQGLSFAKSCPDASSQVARLQRLVYCLARQQTERPRPHAGLHSPK